MNGTKYLCTTVFILATGALFASSSVNASAAKSADELIKNIQAAFLAKDVEALIGLYHQGGNISQRFSKKLLANWKKTITESELLAIESRPLPQDFNAERVIDGVRYSLNVDVLGFIELKLNSKEWGEELQHVPHGEVEGNYHLANVVEEQLQGTGAADSKYSVVMSGGAGVSFEGFCDFIASGTEQRIKFAAEVDNRSTNASKAKPIEAEKIKRCQMSKISGEKEISLSVEKIVSTDPFKSETVFFEETLSDSIQYSPASE